MVWTPRVTVAAVVERNGRFLLVEEEDASRRVVNQPAGHLEAGESLIQAARRETLEETGWDFEPTSLVGLYRWVHPSRGLTFLRACFAGVLTTQHPERPLDPDILATVWLERATLARRPLRSPLVLRCVDDYLAGRRYPLDLLADLPTETPNP